MNRISLFRLGVKLSHRSSIGLGRISRADGASERGDRIIPLEHDRHARAGSHESRERAEEWPLPVNLIESAGLSFREVQHACGENPETGILEVRDDLS